MQPPMEPLKRNPDSSLFRLQNMQAGPATQVAGFFIELIGATATRTLAAVFILYGDPFSDLFSSVSLVISG